jgi:hypothetical protein
VLLILVTGDDSISVDGTGTGYGIYNNGGSINTGDGNDSIIANEGFESGPNSSGSVFLGEGEDYIKVLVVVIFMAETVMTY